MSEYTKTCKKEVHPTQRACAESSGVARTIEQG